VPVNGRGRRRSLTFVSLLLLFVSAGCGGQVAGDSAAADAGPLEGVPVVRIAAAGDRACALREDGRVFCFGIAVDVERAVAEEIVDLPPARGIAVAHDHACVVTTAGDVVCWGKVVHRNTNDGRPTRVPLPSAAAEVVCSTGHCCALLADGEVHCWGENRAGQADPKVRSKASPSPVPIDLQGLVAEEIAVGLDSSCARVRGGTVRCWGAFDGLGYSGGDRPVRPIPVDVPGLAGVSLLRAGANTVCAVPAGGAVQCWGFDLSFQLLREGVRGIAHDPTTVPGFDATKDFAFGLDHVCGLREAGDILCFGVGLGHFAGAIPGPKVGERQAGRTVLPRPAVAVTSGAMRACALDADGVVFCWGRNRSAGIESGNTVPARIAIPR